MILDQLAASSLFSNSTFSPNVFVVYAHGNENEGIAYDLCVRKTISWLQRIHARILSDQSPLPLLLPRIEGTEAIRNIVANQMCLLPVSSDDERKPTRTSVDKVIVCGSEVLEGYYNKPSARLYIEDIVRICTDGAEQSRGTLESRLRERVEKECDESDFHHIITELAFLEVRGHQIPETHGMVPVALTQRNADEAPMRYLPIFRNTDVKLKLKSPAASHLHGLFFKILTQLFPEDRDFIEPFRECYGSVTKNLKLDDKVSISRQRFDSTVNPRITKAYQTYWRLFCIVVRDGKLQAYTGKLSESVSHFLKDEGMSTQHKILSWLSPYSAPEIHGRFHDSGSSRVDGTCDWIVQSQEFLRWCECQGSALLYLCGSSKCCDYTTLSVLNANGLYKWVQARLTARRGS